MNVKNGNSKALPKNNKPESKANGSVKSNFIANGFNSRDAYQSTYSKNFQKKINTTLSNQVTISKEKPLELTPQLGEKACPSSITFSSKFPDMINKNKLTTSTDDEKEKKLIMDDEEQIKKLKETIQHYSQYVRKNEGAGVNTLFKVRTVLLNWLKDSDQDNLEYSKFMTEKKIKYLLKNKEKCDSKIKQLETELSNIKLKKANLNNIIGDIYITYETEELEQEIERFSNSYEIRSGKSAKMIEKFEFMKKILPSVKEYNQIKEQEINKTKEKNEMEKINKSSLQTLGFLTNYYRNIRKKINDLTNQN